VKTGKVGIYFEKLKKAVYNVVIMKSELLKSNTFAFQWKFGFPLEFIPHLTRGGNEQKSL
jgi:hypothetical protein